MKTFGRPDSKQLEQCIFPRMFIRDGSSDVLGGRGAGQFPKTKKSCTAKTEKISCKGSHEEKASASTIIILIFLC